MMRGLRRRRFYSTLAFSIATLATAIGLAILGAILWTLVIKGIGGWSLDLFSEMTPAPGSEGGLRNAIFGSFLMTVIGIGMGAPIGILAGTYLAEYGRRSKLSSVVRFINDVLLSAPSIVIGLFIYSIYVARVGHFSGWAGSFALSLLVIPVVVRTTEDILRLVPDKLREAASALGAPRWKVIVSIVYRAARAGILTQSIID